MELLKDKYLKLEIGWPDIYDGMNSRFLEKQYEYLFSNRMKKYGQIVCYKGNALISQQLEYL